MKIWIDELDGDGGWSYQIDDIGGVHNSGPFEIDDATVDRWHKIEADYEALQNELQALCEEKE